jgi:hypothetical protein
LGQGLGDAFDGELGTIVDPEPRHADEASDRRDIDDVAASHLAHVGEHGAGDVQDAEDVDLELSPDLLFVDFLDGAHRAVPGVVDQHVDASERV